MRKPSGYWNYERCKEITKEFNSISEFQKKYSGAYYQIRKNDWRDVFSHMEEHGNYLKRIIYAYVFEDTKAVYVGLTYNLIERKSRHNKEGSVFEEKFLGEYISLGYSKINKAKTGSIGGNYIIWNKENCTKEALKYETRSEFQDKSRGAYKAACKNRWIDEITNHMKTRRVPMEFWNNLENCRSEALKYKNITEFIKKSRNAYEMSKKNGYLDEIKKLFV